MLVCLLDLVGFVLLFVVCWVGGLWLFLICGFWFVECFGFWVEFGYLVVVVG